MGSLVETSKTETATIDTQFCDKIRRYIPRP